MNKFYLVIKSEEEKGDTSVLLTRNLHVAETLCIKNLNFSIVEIEEGVWINSVKKDIFCCELSEKEFYLEKYLEELNLEHCLNTTSLMFYLNRYRSAEVKNHSDRYAIELCWGKVKLLNKTTVLEDYKTSYNYKMLLKAVDKEVLDPLLEKYIDKNETLYDYMGLKEEDIIYIESIL